MAQLDEQPLIGLGSTPIAGVSPCGSDASEDEQYIFVIAELAKRGRIMAGEPPDWYRMETDAADVLRSKSKDIEIAVALGTALFKQHGYDGLAAALGLFTEMIRNFWEGMFPARPRRRKAKIEGLTDLFSEGGWFRDNQPSPNDFDALDLCATRIEELKQVLTEKMPDDPPDFTKFIRGVRELAAKRPKPAAIAPDSQAAQPTTPGAAAASGDAGFSAGAVEDKEGAVSAILKAASFLRNADPTDPLAYAVVRIIKWSQLSLPSSDDAKYEIQPPESATIDALSHQFSSSLWQHLLKGAEASFRSGDPLWLDLQRFVCSAMVGLGPAFDDAREMVIALTAGLVRRLGEGVFDLRFRGGEPLCSGETRMWIESEVAAPPKAGGGASASNGKLTEASSGARKLAGSGKLKEALQQLQEGMGACTQRRDRFLWRLQIAQLCFDSKRLQLASPLLEECYSDVQRYHVDEWEPSLAVEVARTYYRCRKGIMAAEKNAPPEAAQRLSESFARLCQLDPVAALAADPAGK